MKHVFIDEAGNKDVDLPKAGATSYYVVAAAIVNDDDYNGKFISAAEKLAEQHFSGSQIKSSNVGNNTRRRHQVLSGLSDLPAHYYGLVVDKRRLHSERGGLRYGRIFYKYILRIAQAELLASFPEIDMTIDDHGSEEFKESFLGYMDRHYAHDLFAKNSRRFAKSRDSRGIQVADFVAGSLMKAVESREASGDWPPYFDALRPNLTFNGPWPRGQFPYHLQREDDEQDHRFHEDLIELALHRAQTFIATNEGEKEPDKRAQVIALNRLIAAFLGTKPRQYVAGPALRQHISAHLPDYRVSGQAFMNKVIAPLRDAGVLIVASEKGYKIPSCMAEVFTHMDNTCRKILPMSSRLVRFSDAVKLATHGTVDLLQESEYAFLRHLQREA